jgi:signal transduction histidine kinase
MRYQTHILNPRTWREYAFLWAALPLAALGLAWFIAIPSVTAGVAITVVGLYLPAAMVVGARLQGTIWRSTTNRLLDAGVQTPPAFVAPKGFWHRLAAMWTDRTGWRAIAFGLISFPLSIATFVASTTLLAIALGGSTIWIWGRFLPQRLMEADGTMQRSFSEFGAWGYLSADRPAHLISSAAVGLALLVAWPFVNRALAGVWRAKARVLLGSTEGEQRIAALRASRKAVIDDADQRLRGIERDLHDGTQARLVAMAMQLDQARGLLATDPTAAAELLDGAHATSKDTIAELRDIVRGIHTPALDAGLSVALETLAARSTPPVTVAVDPQVGQSEASGALSPAAAAAVYYSAAELLTNAAKHAGASNVAMTLDVLPVGDDGGQAPAGRVRRSRVRDLFSRSGAGEAVSLLLLSVNDDGHGGAEIRRDAEAGSGLAGLADRAEAFDGTLDISSPEGGPTTVTVTLPLAA